MLLTVVLGCECLTYSDGVQSEIFGFIMIAVVTIAVHLNITVVVCEGFHHGKLIYTRISNFWNKTQKAQIVPSRKSSIDGRAEEAIRVDTQNDQPADSQEESRIRQEAIKHASRLGESGQMHMPDDVDENNAPEPDLAQF